MPNILDWSYWVHTTLGGLHFAAALFCLLTGPILFTRRKGTRSHRILGIMWVIGMFGVNISALVKYDISGRPTLFHFFALMSLAALIPAFIMIQRYKRTRDRNHLITHQMCMAWAYYGLAAAGVWQVGLRIAVHYLGAEAYGLLLWVFGGLTFVCAGGLNLYLRRMFVPRG